MTASNPWNRANVTVSDTVPPTLADVLGLDPEDIEEWLPGTENFAGDVVVLAELSWDISGDDGWSLYPGGESGNVYLAACGLHYWFVQCSAEDREADSVNATSDNDAVTLFLEGFVDGNTGNTIIYLRDAHEESVESQRDRETASSSTDTADLDAAWTYDEAWVYGEELGNLVFVPERVARSYVHDVELAKSLRSIGALKQHRAELQLLWLAPSDEDIDDSELGDDELYVWYEASDEYPRLATFALGRWPEDLEDLGVEDVGMVCVPALHIDPTSETEVVAAIRERGYQVRRDDKLFLQATDWVPPASDLPEAR